jgi:hypothetical protein
MKKIKNTFNEGFLPPYYMMYTIRRTGAGTVSVGTYVFSNVNSGVSPDLSYRVSYKRGEILSIEFG